MNTGDLLEGYRVAAAAYPELKPAFTAETAPGSSRAIIVANADGSGIEQVT